MIKLLNAFVATFFFVVSFGVFGLSALILSGQELSQTSFISQEDFVKKFPTLTSTLGSTKEYVELSSSVEIVDDGYKYTYAYKNAGKEMTWLVGASMPDCVMGFFSDMPAHYYSIAPGKTVTVSVIDKMAPVEFPGTLILYRKTKIPGLEELYKQRQVKMDVEPDLYFQMQGGTNGWVPKRVK